MLSITQLRAEHDILLALADALENAASGEEPDCLPSFVVLWERFNQLLDIHLLREDGLLYPAALKSSDPEAAIVATVLRQELGCLEERADTLAQKWSEAEVSRGWKAFSIELKSFLAVVRVRIERENDELYPLLEGAKSAVHPTFLAQTQAVAP